MKKLLTIFSVIMAICIASPRAGVAADACQPQSCTGGNEMINIVFGGSNSSGSGMCFGCEEGDDDHECDGNAVVGQKDADGYLQSVYICADGYVDNSWEDASSSAVWCGATEIKPGTFETTADYLCVYSLDGTTIDYSSKTASLPSGGTPCKICKCKPGKVKNADGTGCIDDTSGQTTCENAPSYGQWDGSTCKCNKDGQTDKDSGKTCECQSGLIFDVAQDKCVDPHQSESDDCRGSGGTWDTGNDKCICSTAKGFDETPVDNKCVCADAPNKQYDFSADACVATEQAICTNSGGDWDGTSCTCDSAKHLKEVRGVTPTRCECEDKKRYEYWPAEMKCKLTAQAQREENNFEVLQNDCDESGGTWRGDITNPNSWECVCDAANGLRAENNVCVCLNEMYQRPKPDAKICELTDIGMAKNNCTDARDNNDENVDWIDAGKNSYCKCLDSSKYYDYDTKKCISSLEQWCNNISGAHMMYGKCVCKATGNKPVNGRCPTGTSGGVKTDATTKDNIKTKYNALADISGKWGKSHWKTASGNFNGARLASDSVAGVVLGTVGGVITSNVIKKNQVRGGFEDLRCVIGGQTVADWGDQFMVGVQ